MDLFSPYTGYRLLLLCLFFSATASRLAAQTKYVQGTVLSRSSNEPIVLASVAWKQRGTGMVTDSAGNFRIARSPKPDTLLISCVGYISVSIPIGNRDTGTLLVHLHEKQTEKVEIVAKYNRGLLWWRQIVRAKAANDPLKAGSISCDLYRKLELDLNNITRAGVTNRRILRPFAFIADNIDTVSESSPFLPMFIKESLSRYYSSSHPSKRREEIIATRTSGLNNPEVLRIIESLQQNINVYDNYITLFGKEFVSPLSSNGDGHYNYRGADTQYIAGQRYLHLFFSPKRVGENTFSGDCWIHQPSWGISKIDLEISTTANINFVNRLSIRKEFIRQGDSSWVFARDQFIAGISPLKKDKLSLIARQTNHYSQVRLNRPETALALEKRSAPDPAVELAQTPGFEPAQWDSLRPEPLSVNEQKVYKMVDTLQSIPAFQTYVRTIELIVDGHKKFGKIEIGPWYKWISGNQRERMRLRFDLGTTPEFSKQLRLHGYLAYGTADNQFKGQADVHYKFPGNGGYSFQAAYWRDLDNGRTRDDEEGVTTDNMFSQLIRRHGIRQKFLQEDVVRVAVGKEWPNAFAIKMAASHSSYTTFNPLPPQKAISPNQDDIISTELGLKLRYAPGEKKTTTARRERRRSGDNPIFEVAAAAGIPNIAGSQYSYQKARADVTQNIHLPGWGQLYYQVYGGKIWGQPLPFMLLQMHPGNEIYYYSQQAFNLMSRFEYVSDRYAGFIVEHHFDKKLLGLLPLLRRTNVRQFWNCKAVWGDLSPANKSLNHWEYGTYHMRSLNGRPYIELGTGLDNLFTYFRLDCVWRFAPPQPANLPLPPPKPKAAFGVFGSVHLQF